MPTAIDVGTLKHSPSEAQAFAAALNLLDWVRDLVDDEGAAWPIEPGSLNGVFVATLAKATKTFRASLLLCDHGYGQQATMLNRSLFEQMLLSWWILECTDDEDAVLETLSQHRDHASVLFNRGIAQFSDLELEVPEIQFTQDEIAALDNRFGKYGGQWYGKSLAKIIEDLEGEENSGIDVETLWKLYRFVNSHSNQMLHHSAFGLDDTMTWTDPTTNPVVSLGPDFKWRDSSLWAATHLFGLLIGAVLKALSPAKVEEFDKLLDETNRRFIYLDSDQVKDVGRNDLCPCESGLKFKRCHEPWIK